jgi:hypothetical protein
MRELGFGQEKISERFQKKPKQGGAKDYLST